MTAIESPESSSPIVTRAVAAGRGCADAGQVGGAVTGVGGEAPESSHGEAGGGGTGRDVEMED